MPQPAAGAAEDVALRVDSVRGYYEAVHVGRPRDARGARAARAALAAAAVVAAVLVARAASPWAARGAGRNGGGPPAAAVEEAVASLSTAAGQESATKSLMRALAQGMQRLKTQKLDAVRDQHGRSIYAPHFSEDGVPPGPGGYDDRSNGHTTGVFTGHSMGAKGGPLTFGEGTYYNVFDPDGQSDSGPCDPGQHGPPPPAPRNCTECEIGKWSPPVPAPPPHHTPRRITSLCRASSHADSSDPVRRLTVAGPSTAQRPPSIQLCNAPCNPHRLGRCPGDDIDNKKYEQVFDCPEHSTTLQVGAYRPEDCKCSPGWWGIASYKPAENCQMCVADEFCPGGLKKFKCPERSSSEDEAAFCVCDPGYFGADHDNCIDCTAGSYCPGGLNNISRCTPNSNSPTRSDDGTDCQCVPGHYEPVPSETPLLGPDCVPCAKDTYCPGGAGNVPCPVNSESRPGSDAVEDCTCIPGYFGFDANTCSECPEGNYCSGGFSKVQCPDHSNAPAGSKKLSDCTCNAGWAGSDPTKCTICPAGFYCPGHGVVKACQFGAESDEGSDKCRCKDGYQMQMDEAPYGPGLCDLCPADSFCGGGEHKEACQPDSSSPKGSKYKTSCICNAGFYADAAGSCVECPVGSYCPGGLSQKKIACPVNSNTYGPGKTELSDCYCDPGFAGENPEQCSLCPSGFFCPGSGTVKKCPDNGHSGTGASLCECDLGYEYKHMDDTCFRCPANFYCPRQEGHGDMTPIPCPENAHSPEGSFEPIDCKCNEGFENAAYDFSINW